MTLYPSRRSARKPPEGLTGDSATFWSEIQATYGIVDAAGLHLLRLAAEAHQRMRAAQDVIAREGLLVSVGTAKVRAHPMLVIERDSRFAVAAMLKQLNLDVEPIGKIGRPPGTSKAI